MKGQRKYMKRLDCQDRDLGNSTAGSAPRLGFVAFIAINSTLYHDKTPLDHDTNGWGKQASPMADTRE